MTIWTVRDVNEAIALAEDLRAAGRFDLFRGQRDSNWEVQSSLARLDDNHRLAATERFGRFYDWIRRSGDILPYVGDDDEILAIAQHYGIATPLVDVTTDPRVAGFFALDGERGPTGSIFMLNRGDFVRVAGPMADAMGGRAQIIEPDVQHLWRLQAQHGLFLECSFPLDHFYPLDRINFGHSDVPAALDRSLIYPPEKSHLERELDHYFAQERMQEGMEMLLADERVPHLIVGYDAVEEAARAAHLEGWPPAPQWLQVPDERWAEQLAARDRPNQPLPEDPRPLIATRRGDLTLAKMPLDRDQPLADRLWNGMRPLPYHDDQIARALSRMIELRRAVEGVASPLWTDMRAAVQDLFDQPVEVEMAIANGSGTRALVSASHLLAAMKPQVREEARAKAGENLSEQAEWVLMTYYASPRRVFERNGLVELFVDAVVPWQIANKRPIAVFAPDHITTVGMP